MVYKQSGRARSYGTVGWLIDPLLRGEVDFLAIFEEEEGGGL